MLGRTKAIKPFAVGGSSRAPIIAIFVTFALISATTIALSVTATKASQHRTNVIQVAARQRTLAERYFEEILLVRAGKQADPTYTAGVLAASAAALLEGGKVPAVNGDDDETTLSPAEGHVLRAQFVQEQHLAADLAAAGEAVLRHRSMVNLPETAHEHVSGLEPILRLRVLAALTSEHRVQGGPGSRTRRRIQPQQPPHQPGAARRGRPVDHAPARLRAAPDDPPPERPLPQPRAVLERPRGRARRGRLPLRQPLGWRPWWAGPSRTCTATDCWRSSTRTTVP